MLNYEYPPLGGGAAIATENLAQALGDLNIKSDIVTMHMKGLKREETDGNVRIFRVPSIRKRKDICDFSEMISYIPSAFYKSSKLMRQEKYSINHTHFIIPTGLVSLFLWRIYKLPYVISVHGSDVPGFNPDRFNFLHILLKNPWREVVLNCTLLIPLSERIQKMIKTQIEHHPIKIVPNALQFDRFNPTNKKQSILVVTRLLPRKGVQYLLEAIKLFNIDIHVDIVGEGPFRQTLEKYVRENHLKVKFHGWIDNSNSKLTQLYQESEFFVFPSESENFPIVLLEAMAAQSSIITTKFSGCEYVVADSGLLVPPRNPRAIGKALIKLIDDPLFSQNLGIKARKRFEEKFNWKIVAKQYLDIYQEISSGTKGYLPH